METGQPAFPGDANRRDKEGSLATWSMWDMGGPIR